MTLGVQGVAVVCGGKYPVTGTVYDPGNVVVAVRPDSVCWSVAGAL